MYRRVQAWLQRFDFLVSPTLSRPALAVDDPAVPILARNAAFSTTLQASGGFAPYYFTVGRGALPPGMTLDLKGTLSGAPSSLGHFEATLRVFDSSGQIVDTPLALDVVASLPEAPAASKAAPAGANSGTPLLMALVTES